MNNVTTIKTAKTPGAKTIEDAKLMQKLVEHLEAIRQSRDYLAQCKEAKAVTINLTAPVPERFVPPTAMKARDSGGGPRNPCGYGDYRYAPNGGWTRDCHLHEGKFNPEGKNGWPTDRGHIATLGWRVMDAVRAAVNDEVEKTEEAIRTLGFEVPPG